MAKRKEKHIATNKELKKKVLLCKSVKHMHLPPGNFNGFHHSSPDSSVGLLFVGISFQVFQGDMMNATAQLFLLGRIKTTSTCFQASNKIQHHLFQSKVAKEAFQLPGRSFPSGQGLSVTVKMWAEDKEVYTPKPQTWIKKCLGCVLVTGNQRRLSDNKWTPGSWNGQDHHGRQLDGASGFQSRWHTLAADNQAVRSPRRPSQPPRARIPL